MSDEYGVPDEMVEKLNGTGEDHVLVAGVPVTAGSAVILRPGVRRSDVQDMFLKGRRATVRGLRPDVSGVTYLAVTIDDDPAVEWQLAQDRFRYFTPDEVEPVAGDAEAPV